MSKRIPFRDLGVRDPELRAELLAAVERVLIHGRLILGPEHDQFESVTAEYCQRRFCVAVNSGTDALYLALRTLDIGAGDEVITTPLSWIATVNAIVLTGARPVFVDIGPDLNIDPARIEAAITPRTRAILPVHFTGQVAAMAAILAAGQKHGLPVVEDGGQAFAARQNGAPSGSFGTLGCFSMNPMKVWNAYGEAGAIVGDDPRLRDRLRSLRYAGTVNKEDCREPGLNGRLDTLQAAMLLVSHQRLPQKLAQRRRLAKLYDEHLDGVVERPRVPPGNEHTYYSYTILAERRPALIEFLAARGIETKIQHKYLMPLHSAYRHRWPHPDMPVAQRAVERILCLPNDDHLSEADVLRVIAAVRDFYGKPS